MYSMQRDQVGCGGTNEVVKATFGDIDLLSDVTKQIEGHTICAFGEGLLGQFKVY